LYLKSIDENKDFKIYSALINLKNPEENTEAALTTRRKPESPKDGYIAYRQNKKVDDKWVLDKSIVNEYVVFDPQQIHILGNKQDIEGFKNFVSTQPTQAPLVREVSDESGKKFPGLLKDQRGVTQVLDFETNKPMLAPQVYDESKFVSGNVYNLTTEAIKEIAQENPGKLFVFDDYFPTTTGATKTTGSDYTRQAWIPAKAMGVAFGIPTLSLGVSTSLPVTDQNYDQLKAQIDQVLDGLLEKKRQGVEIVFPSRGLGQSLIGFATEPTQNVYVGNAPAPSLFVYLSKRLLQDFGYNNPTLSNLTTKTAGVTETLGRETGIAFVQDYYKTVKAQTVTDADIKEFIKKCKGLS
jgi:hypothetical protein